MAHKIKLFVTAKGAAVKNTWKLGQEVEVTKGCESKLIEQGYLSKEETKGKKEETKK